MKKQVLAAISSITLAVVALLALAGCSTATTSGTGVAPAVTAKVSTTSWGKELASIPVKAKLPLVNYKRVADYGPAWADVDGQPCDTRDQILKRDLTNITLSGSCEVTSGTLHDPYTGQTIHFVRGVQTSAAVQIDHVVPLANSWVEGAQNLSPAQREQMANDPDELLAVDGPTNESKGDMDASQWLPAVAASRCMYVEKQITVKVKYHLWVTPAERDAIAKVLTTCGSEPVPTAAPTAAPVPAPAVKPSVKPSTATATVSPGGYCTSKGTTGKSAAGKTYTCGLKGSDKSGRYHWNS